MSWNHSEYHDFIQSLEKKQNQNECGVKYAHSEITRLNSSLKMVVGAWFFQELRTSLFANLTRFVHQNIFALHVSETPAEYIWTGTAQSPFGSSPEILIHGGNFGFPPFRFIFDLKKSRHCVWVKVLWAFIRLRVSGNAVEKVRCMVAWKDDKHMLNRTLMHRMENQWKPKEWVDQRFTELTQTQCVWVYCERDI